MPDILKAGIAKKVHQALGGLLFPMVLIKVRQGNRGEATSGPNPVSTEYSVKGFLSHYKVSQIDGTLVQVNDRKALLLGESVPVAPSPGDLIRAEGKTWKVITVTRDPAGATYSCQVR